MHLRLLFAPGNVLIAVLASASAYSLVCGNFTGQQCPKKPATAAGVVGLILSTLWAAYLEHGRVLLTLLLPAVLASAYGIDQGRKRTGHGAPNYNMRSSSLCQNAFLEDLIPLSSS